MGRRGYQPSRARAYLPRSIAVLGELGPLALAVEDGGTYRYYGIGYKPGRVLCASPDGREMFVLKPDAGDGPPRANQQALQALDLFERFHYRDANELYNCVVPAFREPVYRGELAVIHYFTEKHMLGDADAAPAEYVHFFEKPGERPAYVPIYSVGHDQYYIPAGEWVASDRGIEYAPPPARRPRRYA